MDFKTVLAGLLKAFDEHNICYALIGGFAIGLWGGTRSTVDLDFLVQRDDMEKVDKIMAGLGYECRNRTENVSQYISPSRIMGEVDFLHAFRKASMEMLRRAVKKEIFSSSLQVNTLRPEDLIGLKLQAIRNNSRREESDLADIRMMIRIHQDMLDWELIREYCDILEMGGMYEKMRREI